MRPSHQCLVKPVGGGALGPGAYVGGGDQTIGTICEIPDDALWVRFRFACWSAEPVAVANAAYAASSELGDGYAAHDATGEDNPALWRPVTFGAPAGACAAQHAPGSRRECLLPGIIGGHAGDYEPQPICSDWLPFNPLPRRDGGAGTLVNLRLHVLGGHAPYRLGCGGAPGLNVTLAGSYSAGNNAAPPFAGAGHPFAVMVAHGFDVICGHPTRTLIVVGDSIASGDFTTGASTSYGLAAATLLAASGHRITPAILANPGQTSASYIRNAHRMIAGEIADLAGAVIVIQSWSGNDPQTMAGAEAAFRAALALATYCAARGLIPILATAAPVCVAAEHEPGRAYGNGLARGSGLPCLDIDRIAGTGETPNRYRPGFNADDDIHLADAGQREVARELANLVESLLGSATG